MVESKSLFQYPLDINGLPISEKDGEFVMDSKGVLLNSSLPISFAVFSDGEGEGDAYTILPIPVLGTSYYTVVSASAFQNNIYTIIAAQEFNHCDREWSSNSSQSGANAQFRFERNGIWSLRQLG